MSDDSMYKLLMLHTSLLLGNIWGIRSFFTHFS